MTLRLPLLIITVICALLLLPTLPHDTAHASTLQTQLGQRSGFPVKLDSGRIKFGSVNSGRPRRGRQAGDSRRQRERHPLRAEPERQPPLVLQRRRCDQRGGEQGRPGRHEQPDQHPLGARRGQHHRRQPAGGDRQRRRRHQRQGARRRGGPQPRRRTPVGLAPAAAQHLRCRRGLHGGRRHLPGRRRYHRRRRARDHLRRVRPANLRQAGERQQRAGLAEVCARYDLVLARPGRPERRQGQRCDHRRRLAQL